ncbi:PREDICTED: endogenous retrovirus group K member 19 Pol protein-like [Rhinopithecus bieti]|uniref:endogenous retrovirus group K member 19 Pol protein-like n=1 Tax=Rhinopithecus bieti TaxID=61621 RepID=UPI00083C37BE|nr:PREDICTED: endogenous retrovirus group K member 19 Pol protein-like [Rhinopithecus bieti]
MVGEHGTKLEYTQVLLSNPHGPNSQPIWIPSRHLKPYEPDAKKEFLGRSQRPLSYSHIKTDAEEDPDCHKQHTLNTATCLGTDQEAVTVGGRKPEERGTTSCNE